MHLYPLWHLNKTLSIFKVSFRNVQRDMVSYCLCQWSIVMCDIPCMAMHVYIGLLRHYMRQLYISLQADVFLNLLLSPLPVQNPTSFHIYWVVTARSELRKVLFLALSVTLFCLYIKYLGNLWTDLRQIHRDVFGPSLWRVWRSRSILAACMGFMFGKHLCSSL